MKKEKSISCTLLYESYGMQISGAFHTFVFGDIGLSRKKLKTLKKLIFKHRF